jgi:hypothetical protein
MNHNPGIGATDELSLRVSVATLVRVVFENPTNGEWMLALERNSTLLNAENEKIVEIKSQPFGGAIRILDMDAIHNLIGDFHFDSERSRNEQDFRIFIRPSSWSALREFCIQRLSHADDPVLETDPTRELIEEIDDALKISLQPGQYVSKPVATVAENEAAPTENIHALNLPTVRVYRIFETTLLDFSLAHAMLNNSEGLSTQELCKLASDDFQNGGKGRANAILTLPLKRVTDAYLAMSSIDRNTPMLFEKNRLTETIPVILEDISVQKYQRL